MNYKNSLKIFPIFVCFIDYYSAKLLIYLNHKLHFVAISSEGSKLIGADC